MLPLARPPNSTRIPLALAACCLYPAARMASALSTTIVFPLSLNDPSLLGDANVDGDTTFDVINPASKDGAEVLAKVSLMDRSDANRLVQRSGNALESWRDGTTGTHRAGILSRWSNLIKENSEDLAAIMTYESGKPLVESRGEVSYATSFLDYYATEAVRPSSAGGGFITPTTFVTPEGAPRGKILAVQEAVGVTAMITPWNFPAAMITRKVGPALAAGCTAILKPSELTPLTAIALYQLGRRAGIPDGVFEIVTADRKSTPGVGEEFCTNPTVRKVSFTGSVTVGKEIMKQSAETVKKVSLELGGNAPFIVFDDTDIDLAVSAAISAKFRNAGQTCVCADRFLIHSSIEDKFCSKVIDRVSQFTVGCGIDPSTTMGPLITATAAQNIKEKVDEAISEGAKCILGGSLLPNVGPNFFEPTILKDISPSSRIWKEETFGPVFAMISFDKEEEAIELANDSSLGLASYLCSKDLSRVFRVAGKLETGLVGINEGIIATSVAPFGGVKESGLGREGSSKGIDEYLETKYMFINFDSKA